MTTEVIASKTAKLVRELKGFTGQAWLFKLSEPMGYDYDYETEQNQKQTSFVVVSATVAPFSGPETYIFAANKSGEVIGWSELDGSYRGGLSYQQALEGAGFEVVK